MKFNFNNKKIIWLAALIIIAILAAYLFYAPAAGAAQAPKAPTKLGSLVSASAIALGYAAGKATEWMIATWCILYLIYKILGWLLGAAGIVLDGAFALAIRPE